MRIFGDDGAASLSLCVSLSEQKEAARPAMHRAWVTSLACTSTSDVHGDDTDVRAQANMVSELAHSGPRSERSYRTFVPSNVCVRGDCGGALAFTKYCTERDGRRRPSSLPHCSSATAPAMRASCLPYRRLSLTLAQCRRTGLQARERHKDRSQG